MRRDAGKRRHRVQIHNPLGATQDSVGQPVLDRTPLATVWARVEPLNGREYFTAQQVVAGVTTRITMDYFPGLLATMPIVYEDVVYTIQDIIDVDLRHITHVLMCGSGVVAN